RPMSPGVTPPTAGCRSGPGACVCRSMLRARSKQTSAGARMKVESRIKGIACGGLKSRGASRGRQSVLTAAQSPLAREHRVGDEVFEVIVYPLGLPVRALFDEAEPLGDAAASAVLDRAVNLHAVQAQ